MLDRFMKLKEQNTSEEIINQTTEPMLHYETKKPQVKEIELPSEQHADSLEALFADMIEHQPILAMKV